MLMLTPKQDAMKLSSDVFVNNGAIPKKYTCDGLNVNPPLRIEHVPDKARSLALVVDDPDAPMGTWDHWEVWNIMPKTTTIAENSVPGTEGKNSWGQRAYGGPCPPRGTHRYFFKLYALDTELKLAASTDKKTLERAMEGHILAKAELIGLYQRSR